MPTEMSSGMPVITLDINEMGQMKQRLPRLTQEEQLANTLLQGLYPGIRVARLNVPPGRLEDHQENEVHKAMRSFGINGRKQQSPTSGSWSRRASSESSCPTQG